jgi:hypothetical protein
MARLYQITEFLGRRGIFLVLYGLTAIVVGALNVFVIGWLWAVPQLILLDASPDQVQRMLLSPLMAVLGRASGTEVAADILVNVICVSGPLLLVALAFFRGRRSGVLLVAYPIVGLIITFVGWPLFHDFGNTLRFLGPILAARICDIWCLYLGAQPDPVDEVE